MHFTGKSQSLWPYLRCVTSNLETDFISCCFHDRLLWCGNSLWRFCQSEPIKFPLECRWLALEDPCRIKTIVNFLMAQADYILTTNTLFIHFFLWATKPILSTWTTVRNHFWIYTFPPTLSYAHYHFSSRNITDCIVFNQLKIVWVVYFTADSPSVHAVRRDYRLSVYVMEGSGERKQSTSTAPSRFLAYRPYWAQVTPYLPFEIRRCYNVDRMMERCPLYVQICRVHWY